MTPAAAIASLDRQIGLHGQIVTLRRYTGVGAARTSTDTTVGAIVRDYRPDELVGGITQGDTQIVLSPTDVLAGGGALPQAGDQVFIDGDPRMIEAAPPVRIGNAVARINVQVKG